MQNQLFEAALGIAKPWYVRVVDFDAARKVLTIGIDFVAGSRFAAPGAAEGPLRVCAVTRRRFPVGASPTRRFAPAGSNRSSHGGNEMAEAFD